MQAVRFSSGALPPSCDAVRHEVRAEGVELHQAFIDAGKERLAQAELKGDVTFHQMPASEFCGEKASYDVALCIGASFAIGSFEEMAVWLRRFVRPGGVMAIGDIYARHPNVPEESAAHFGGGRARSFADTALHLNRDGLTLIGLIDSSLDEWDRYESLHWKAADEWATQNAEHPERQNFLDQTERFKESHLRFDRASLGWAMFVSRVT